MAIEEWEKNEDGNIKVRPLAAYETVVFQRMALLMRLQFLNPEDQPNRPSGSLQLGISASQLVQLIEDLLRQLERMQTGTPSGTKAN